MPKSMFKIQYLLRCVKYEETLFECRCMCEIIKCVPFENKRCFYQLTHIIVGKRSF